jgi:hypothetical protein
MRRLFTGFAGERGTGAVRDETEDMQMIRVSFAFGFMADRPRSPREGVTASRAVIPCARWKLSIGHR